jgi:hypothetical protein
VSALTRRLLLTATGWTLVFGLTAIAVHPERCGSPTDRDLRDAAQLAVDWFAANIEPDGDFLYRYDRERAQPEPGYNDTRHAGVLLSLWQAERAGILGAGEVAERAFARVERRLVDTVIGPAFGGGATLPSGATGLLVAALDERRLATGATDLDDLLVSLGNTLAASVNEDGSVSADIGRQTGPGDDRSPFFTGEVMWALARLHLTFPTEGFDEAALRIRAYVIDARDDVERWWPPLTDHWAAYAFETMDRWPTPPALSPADNEWLDRQLGLFGLQVRYESQRRGGVTRLTRGPIALAAGVGTLEEGLGNHLLWLMRRGQRRADIDVLTERADCAAWLLVQRQVSRQDAADDIDPERSIGAWFRLGDTQMDDQQHALSALLILRDVRRAAAADGPGGPS